MKCALSQLSYDMAEIGHRAFKLIPSCESIQNISPNFFSSSIIIIAYFYPCTGGKKSSSQDVKETETTKDNIFNHSTKPVESFNSSFSSELTMSRVSWVRANRMLFHLVGIR